MKYLITNQNFYKSKFPLFHEFTFLEKHVSVNKATLQIFDRFIITFNYLFGPNILQIVYV